MLFYYDRQEATDLLREMGVKIGDSGLANLAYKGRGPRTARINGRELTTKEWLMEWVEAQASNPRRHRQAVAPSKRRPRSAGKSVPAAPR